MKIRYLLLLITGLSLFLGGCYDEDKAVPSGDYSPVRFEFPQGNESWDKLFEQMYDDFGICVIYKDFTPGDLNKNWTISAGGDWTGHPVPDDHMPKYEDLLKNYLIPFLGKKEIVEACSPLYLYLAEDLGGGMASYGMDLGVNLKGLDFWAIGLVDTIKIIFPYEGVEDFRKGLVSFVYNQIVENAVVKGLVPEPNDFQSGIDYKTEVEKSDVEDPNYYATRGFVGLITYSEPGVAFCCIFSWSDYWYGNIEQMVTAKGGDFMMFTRAAMRWTKEEFEEKFPPEKYPLVNARYKMVVEQFKNYGFDLPGFAKKVKELPTPF